MPDAATHPSSRQSGPGSPSGALTVLDPSSVTIYRPDGGFPNLILAGKVCYPRIRVVRNFPVSGRSIYISLRDWDNNEIGLIESVAFLDGASRRIVQEELEKRYFVSQVTDIHSVKNRYGFTIFDVETNRGRRIFNVHDRHRNVVHLGRGRVLIIDTDDCQYDIPNCQRLSHHAQRQLYQIL